MRGMGLLPADTVFADSKTRTQASGSIANIGGIFQDLSGTKFEGYEIHMGVTRLHAGCEPLTYLRTASGSRTETKADGAYHDNVCGTYVHGLFDREKIAEKIVRALAQRKGISPENLRGVDYRTFRDSQYDILADTVRKSLDMKRVYAILENGI